MEPGFWDESSLQNTIKCEGNLNFSAAASEDDEYGYHKKKLSRDPLSHRIIEKRRRDRMNNCLADLSRLLPSEYLKKGRGRIEKTEIIEMAIKHMKHLQSHPCTDGTCCGLEEEGKSVPLLTEHYKLGFHECLSETMHYLVEVEGFFAGDTLCVQLISHLHRHCDNMLKGDAARSQERQQSAASGAAECHGPRSGGGLSQDLGGGARGGPGGGGPPSLVSPSSSSDIVMSVKEELLESDKASHTSTLTLHEHNSDYNNHTSNSSPSPQSQHSSERGESLYKFKNSIRKRFATERAGRGTRSPPPPTPHPVPVFALSARGGYYLPLSLDYSVLSATMAECDDDEDPALVLHPVTISVNFRPTKLRPEYRPENT